MTPGKAARCPWCRTPRHADGHCACATAAPLPPTRLVSETLDLESVDEDGPLGADQALWLDEEELPF